MAFVNDKEEVVGEIVDEAERSVALSASVKIAGVVLDATAVTQLLYHLEVVVDSLLEAFGFKGFVNGVEVVSTFKHVCLYLTKGICHVFFRGEKVAGGIYDCLGVGVEFLSADGLKTLDAFYFVIPETDAVAEIGKRGEDVNSIPLHAEATVDKFYLVADVLSI